MSHFNAGKNPPWARTAGDFAAQPMVSTPINPQQMLAPAVVQYPQANASQTASVYQAQFALQQQALNMQQIVATNAQQLFNAQVNTNPTRQLNAAAFATPVQTPAPVPPAAAPPQVSAPSKQRVFTGIVTKMQDTFGFVDEEVFFQKSCCVKGSNPMVNDRVLVEAVYIPNMPFKWNATRVQVLPMNDNTQQLPVKKTFQSSPSGFTHTPVNSLSNNELDEGGRRDRERRRLRSPERTRGRPPPRRRTPPTHEDDNIDNKRRRRERRESEDRESSSRRRSRSLNKSSRVSDSRKYRMRIPEYSLHVKSLNVFNLRSRYSEMYVPSDFLSAHPKWSETFSPECPLSIDSASQFYIVSNKDVDSQDNASTNGGAGGGGSTAEPSDVDYLYSAKVMLLSFRSFSEIVNKCVPLTQDQDKDNSSSCSSSSSVVHPTRLIHCLVGMNTRGKNETMAIGGPWSPSLDGADPVGDPNVLIKTAIRTCKALTGIDLTPCTKWYRFVEIYYHRSKSTRKGIEIPARFETVVIYIPDVWSLSPTRIEWGRIVAQLEINTQSSGGGESNAVAAAVAAAEDEAKDEDSAAVVKREPTHYTQLEPKTMKVSDLREELEARNMSSKGLRLQLSARLCKVLKVEQDAAEEAKNKASESVEDVKEKSVDECANDGDSNKEEVDEKNKHRGEEKHQLPDTPHILVYPSKTAKGGKYTCKKMSLSVLLDYRAGDNKEHSFEVSLFAELFNEMLMRDFGLRIYKSILDAPDKDEKEKKEEKENSNEGEKDSVESDKCKDGEDKNKDKSSKEKDVDDGDRKSKRDSEKERRDRDKERKRKDEKKIKYYTSDPMLLLSYLYFDVSRIGYIYDNDLERLLQILGLHLTRAQTKKLMSKVLSSRDSSCNYRKLTDMALPESGEMSIVDTKVTVSADMSGVKCELPLFQTVPRELVQSPPPTPAKRKRRGQMDVPEDKNVSTTTSAANTEFTVNYKGAIVNVDNLNEQVKRNELARLETEARLVELKQEYDTVKHKSDKSNSLIESLTEELNKCKSNLSFTKNKLQQQVASSDVYLSVLMDIQERMIPALDPDEVKRLTKIRQDLTGTPSINLVPLTKVEDILKEESTEENVEETKVKDEPV